MKQNLYSMNIGTRGSKCGNGSGLRIMLGVVFCMAVLAACPNENNSKPNDTNESAVVSVSASAASLAEDEGTANFVIEAMPAPTGDVTVGYTIAGSNGAVDADVDVALADPQTITLTAPDYSHTITVTGQDDDTVETDTETVTITLTSASGGGADLGTATTASFTITDDDTPRVSVSASAASIAEDGGTADFVIEAMPAPTGDVTVGYTIAGSNGAVDADVDVALADPQTITLTAPGYSHTITVTGQDDDTAEADDETVTITLTSASGGGADLGAATTASFTITDNDTPVVSVSASAASIAEDGGTADFVIEAMPAPTGDVTVGYTIAGSNGAVDADVDVALADPQTITLTAPDYSHTITVTGQNDGTPEADTETVTITLTSASGGGAELATGTAITASIAITDDDTSIVSVSTSAASLAENGTTASFIVEAMPKPDDGEISVRLRVDYVGGADASDVSANSGIGFFSITTLSARNNYRSENMVRSKVDTIPNESGEGVKVSLDSLTRGTNIATIGTATATITIIDDD